MPVNPVCKEPKNASTPSATLPRNAPSMVVTTASIRATLRRRTTSVQRRRSRSPPIACQGDGTPSGGQLRTRPDRPNLHATRVEPSHSARRADRVRVRIAVHSTTYRDRYPPDGPTPRASAIRSLAARAFPPHGGPAYCQAHGDPTYLITGVSTMCARPISHVRLGWPPAI